MQDVGAHPFEITVCDPEFVKEGYARGHLIKLRIVKVCQRGTSRERTVGLAKRKRLASGLNFVYSVTFPLGIHSEMMRKYWGLLDTETPSRGKTFG